MDFGADIDSQFESCTQIGGPYLELFGHNLMIPTRYFFVIVHKRFAPLHSGTTLLTFQGPR